MLDLGHYTYFLSSSNSSCSCVELLCYIIICINERISWKPLK